jgi:ceramide glucosyltransferase
LLAIWSGTRFFARPKEKLNGFAPPISILKPVRGLDPDAYENFASFCKQDYPEYEIVFCVGAADDPSMPAIERLQADFPKCRIRVLFGSGRVAANDKVAKLARLAVEAQYEHLAINDSDVRVKPNYLRSVIAPLENPEIGAVTCFYVSIGEQSFIEDLQTAGMLSDFYAALLVARELDGVKFALGPTIATTRTRLAAFGGYEAIENRPGDDLLVGRLIAEQGYRIELSRYVVDTVADYQTLGELLHKRLLHTGAPLVGYRGGSTSQPANGAGLLRYILYPANRNDMANWRLWFEPATSMAENAGRVLLGCLRLNHVGSQFPAQLNSLA